jgi:hypothetical protein
VNGEGPRAVCYQQSVWAAFLDREVECFVFVTAWHFNHPFLLACSYYYLGTVYLYWQGSCSRWLFLRHFVLNDGGGPNQTWLLMRDLILSYSISICVPMHDSVHIKISPLKHVLLPGTLCPDQPCLQRSFPWFCAFSSHIRMTV